jgi:hypothetical protein
MFRRRTLQHAHLMGAGDGLSAVVDIQRGVIILEVLVDSFAGNHLALRDFLVRIALRQELQYLQLALAQWFG